jgi:hypothetical protein
MYFFVALIKAFDTIQHDLLILILQNYCLPNNLTSIIIKLYKDSKVKTKLGKCKILIDYMAGVHQGDNMSPVLFLFVIQAFLDTLKIETQPIEFAYFPENKNGNTHTCKSRLLGQNAKAKGKSFSLQSPFYVDDSAFILNNHFELERTAATLYKHFSRFGLCMHVGSNLEKSKSVAMLFPKTLKEAKLQKKVENTPEDLEFMTSKRIHFVQELKYLGSIITPILNEGAEIESRIKKSWSLIGITKHFFECKNIDIRVKYQVYIAGPPQCSPLGM